MYVVFSTESNVRQDRCDNGGCDLIRLGIVDDHPVFRLGLRGTFDRQKDLKVAWDLGNAAQLLETLASSPVDVILMDLDLGPDEDGLTATRTIKKAHPGVRVIVITASLDNETVAAARRAGANGYLAKDLPVADMLAAIRRLASTGPSRATAGDYLTGGASTGGRSWPGVRGLTKREHEVLAELKRGRTNREIASRLGVSVSTVNKHVQQVLKKLHVRNRAQAVARLHGETTTRVFQGVEART
jgi:DNA-binding NarL/FixJ family response regulator